MLARVIVSSLMTGGLAAAMAYEVWRHRDETLASRWPTFAVLVSFALFMAVRTALAPWAPFPFGIEPVDPIWLAVFLWLIFGHATFAAVFLLAMTLERREAQQRSFAMSDPLTGLLNRRAFADFAARTNRRRAGIRSTMALLVLDLDHFKSVNDRFGHIVGDRVLKAIAEALAETCHGHLVARYGGEEFAVLFSGVELAEARRTLDAARVKVAGKHYRLRETDEPLGEVTFSAGVTQAETAEHRGTVFHRADRLLYAAKAAGRNCIIAE